MKVQYDDSPSRISNFFLSQKFEILCSVNGLFIKEVAASIFMAYKT